MHTAAPRPMLTIEEVAGIFGVTDRTIREWCTRGELEYVKLSHKVLRFKPEWVDDLIARKQKK